MKRATTAKSLEEAVNNIRGAVMIAYPMGLPDYDLVRQILEEREELEGAAAMQVSQFHRVGKDCIHWNGGKGEVSVRVATLCLWERL
eukprot:159762-Pleurochrysis_carterae.AAC.2